MILRKDELMTKKSKTEILQCIKDGIEYIDTIDIEYNIIKTYTGDIDYEPSEPYIRHSIDVTTMNTILLKPRL